MSESHPWLTDAEEETIKRIRRVYSGLGEPLFQGITGCLLQCRLVATAISELDPNLSLGQFILLNVVRRWHSLVLSLFDELLAQPNVILNTKKVASRTFAGGSFLPPIKTDAFGETTSC